MSLSSPNPHMWSLVYKAILDIRLLGEFSASANLIFPAVATGIESRGTTLKSLKLFVFNEVSRGVHTHSSPTITKELSHILLILHNLAFCMYSIIY